MAVFWLKRSKREKHKKNIPIHFEAHVGPTSLHFAQMSKKVRIDRL